MYIFIDTKGHFHSLFLQKLGNWGLCVYLWNAVPGTQPNSLIDQTIMIERQKGYVQTQEYE